MVIFTSREIKDILISMFVIAFVFAYVFSNHNIAGSISFMPVTLVAVGFGFVFHELAHKFVAIRYGCQAEYRMWIGGLLLALLMAFTIGIVFAAPGAVYIHSMYLTKEENGKIALAGPVTNLILALLFLPFLHVPFIYVVAFYGFMVNSFLAFFNLIPFSVLDGAKVFSWSPLAWLVTMGAAFLLMFMTFF